MKKSLSIFNFGLFFIFILFSPPKAYGQKFGLNIADRYNQAPQVGQYLRNGEWVVIMPHTAFFDLYSLDRQKINEVIDHINNHLIKPANTKNLNFILRGHNPNSSNKPLNHPQNNFPVVGQTRPDADWVEIWSNFWLEVLKGINHQPIYFMPWNEPNMSRECSGIGNALDSNDSSCAIYVFNYINKLSQKLKESGLLGNKVKLLSPMINISAPNFRAFVNRLNQLAGGNFFGQFEGISMNLYDNQDCGAIFCHGSELNSALGYSTALSIMGTPSKPVFAVEMGLVNPKGEVTDYPVFTQPKITEFICEFYNRTKDDQRIKMFSPLTYNPEGGSTEGEWFFNTVTTRNYYLERWSDCSYAETVQAGIESGASSGITGSITDIFRDFFRNTIKSGFLPHKDVGCSVPPAKENGRMRADDGNSCYRDVPDPENNCGDSMTINVRKVSLTPFSADFSGNISVNLARMILPFVGNERFSDKTRVLFPLNNILGSAFNDGQQVKNSEELMQKSGVFFRLTPRTYLTKKLKQWRDDISTRAVLSILQDDEELNPDHNIYTQEPINDAIVGWLQMLPNGKTWYSLSRCDKCWPIRLSMPYCMNPNSAGLAGAAVCAKYYGFVGCKGGQPIGGIYGRFNQEHYGLTGVCPGEHVFYNQPGIGFWTTFFPFWSPAESTLELLINIRGKTTKHRLHIPYMAALSRMAPAIRNTLIPLSTQGKIKGPNHNKLHCASNTTGGPGSSIAGPPASRNPFQTILNLTNRLIQIIIPPKNDEEEETTEQYTQYTGIAQEKAVISTKSPYASAIFNLEHTYESMLPWQHAIAKDKKDTSFAGPVSYQTNSPDIWLDGIDKKAQYYRKGPEETSKRVKFLNSLYPYSWLQNL